jgi:hypothetical protein
VNVRPLLIGSGTALVLALAVLGSGLRHRLRLEHPRWARAADAAADRVVLVLGVLVACTVVLAVLAPGPADASGGVRILAGGAAIGLLTGVPFAVERRDARRRLREAPPPREPLPLPPFEADGDDPDIAAALATLETDPAASLGLLGELDPAAASAADLRVRAAAAALLGDGRLARACALRCIQLDPGRGDDLASVGLLLARGGRFREGIRVLERAIEAAPELTQPRLALVEALRLAGRLREAVNALEGRGVGVAPAARTGTRSGRGPRRG